MNYYLEDNPTTLRNKSKHTKIWKSSIIMMLLFSACYQPLPTEEPVLSEEKLQLILKDIHLAESVLTEVQNRETKDSLARVYYHQVLELHQVNPEDFEQSMNARYTTPAQLDTLYTNVITQLQQEKDSLRRVYEEKNKTKQ